MHEQGMIRDLVRKIEEIAKREGVTDVTGVRVWLGALSHCSPEHFREHFIHETPGTLAEGAELEIETSDDPHHPQAQQILLKSVDVPD